MNGGNENGNACTNKCVLVIVYICCSGIEITYVSLMFRFVSTVATLCSMSFNEFLIHFALLAGEMYSRIKKVE